MKYYKYIGSKEQAKEYNKKRPKKGKVYSEEDMISDLPVKEWTNVKDNWEDVSYEWEEIALTNVSGEWEEVVEDEVMVNIDDFKDKVNHPAHYNQGDVECIEAIKSATINKKGIEAVCVGNVIKYLWRYEGKGEPLEDVKKAKRYLEMLIENLETK